MIELKRLVQKILFFTVFISMVLSCQTATIDDGIREVYFEINAKSSSINANNLILAELWRLELDGSTTGADLDIEGSESPIVKQSEIVTWEKGQTIRLELRSIDWDHIDHEVFWCESNVKVYSNSEIIFEKTFNRGESGDSQDNYFKIELE